MTSLNPLPDTFATTREGLHALAEHVIAPLRYLEENRIGLRPTPHGFGTDVLPSGRQVTVIDGVLSDWTKDVERRHDITTLGDAAGFLVIALDEVHDVYQLVTDGDPHRPLNVDVAGATALGEWFTFCATVLQEVRNARPGDETTLSQLWPEHFDLAMEIGPKEQRANVGGSPGDAEHPEPYLYVGPHATKPNGPQWNEPFGASLSYQQLLSGTDPLQWIDGLLDELRGWLAPL